MMPCPYQGWGAIEKCCNKKQRGLPDPSQFSQLIRLIYALLLGRVEQTTCYCTQGKEDPPCIRVKKRSNARV
jgi:hypothetical protein